LGEKQRNGGGRRIGAGGKKEPKFVKVLNKKGPIQKREGAKKEKKRGLGMGYENSDMGQEAKQEKIRKGGGFIR